MKFELPCAVVRDLLPSYVENLTEAETTALLRCHLDQCRDCRSHYEAMVEGTKIPQADSKEVDYLKTVRKKHRKRIIKAVIAAVILVLSAVFAQLFLIGTPAGADSVAAQVTPGATVDAISLSFLNADSVRVLTDLQIQTIDDVIEITARNVLVSPIHPSEEVSVSLNLSGIREVRAFGETIWKDGIVIEGHTLRLMRNQTEFTGNASEVNKLIRNMDLDVPHTLELQTKQEPYGIVLHFTNPIAENRRFLIEGSACLLLSLVDNLGEVSWDDPSGYCDSLTLKDAENMLSLMTDSYNQSNHTQFAPLESIKDYGADAYHLQILRNILGV